MRPFEHCRSRRLDGANSSRLGRDWFGANQIAKAVERFITVRPYRLSKPAEQDLRVITDTVTEQP